MKKNINFSVPQGSVQGAFLFIAYASTIQEVVKKDLTLTGFADDCSICKQFKNKNQARTRLDCNP